MIPVKHLLLVLLVSISVASYAQFRLYEKGHDSYKAGKYDESVKYLTEYLTKSTRDKNIDIDVFYIRALAHYKQNHFTEAIPDFEETLLRGHENKGNIYWFMAKCYDGLQNNEEALNAYNNAIRELVDKPESKSKLLYERSLIHFRTGNIIQTYNDLKEGQEANPSNADIKKQLDKLEKEHVAALRQADIHAKANPAKEPETKGQTTKKTEKTASGSQAKANQQQKPADDKNVVLARNEQQDARSSVKESNSAKTNSTTGNKPVSESSKNASTQTVETMAPAAPTLADVYKDEKRYALVIGNSNYPKAIGVLRNPANDASDMAKELRESNFEVTLLTDATYGQIRAALMKFKEKLDGGEREKTVGLFYYAGHGLQFDDENYLVPVDASVEFEDDIPRYCFPINRMVLANMERSNTRMNIVILDACRNNPFPSLNRSLGNSGLGEMKRARGSFIAYATAPGSVASDGTGRNGLYTQELLKAMKKPGLTIEQVFKEVRMNVLKLSNDKQNTWDSSNIIGEFHFRF
jgi:tetratricopeptide (TPR) repeat protein